MIEEVLEAISPWFVVMLAVLAVISLMLVVILTVLKLIPVNPDPSPTKDVADIDPAEIIAPELIVPVKVGFAILAFKAISLMLEVMLTVLAAISP